VAAAGRLDPYHLHLQLLSNNPRLRGLFGLRRAKPDGALPSPGGSRHGSLCVLLLNEMPTVEVYFVPSTQTFIGLPAIAPAVANAFIAATGRRMRRLPIRAVDLS